MFPSFRHAILLILAVTLGYAAQHQSAAALAADHPLPLKYTAMLGGGAVINALAVDLNGSAYIVGAAFSPLPVTPGAFQTGYKPAKCTVHSQATVDCPVAFAGKLSVDGTALVYLTYLGTSKSGGSGISVDAQGNAWITGAVASSDLPVTPGAFQTTPRSSFVLKLNATGSQVLFATYFGGSGGDVLASQAIDPSGNLYVAGSTSSSDFPITSSAFQTDAGQILPGSNASFAARFDSTGRLVYSTYFHGGNGSSTGIRSIAVDAAGNAYVTGVHTGGSLPTTPGAFETSASAANAAAFAAKLDPAGSKLIYCTYLTANSPVSGTAIAIDGQNNAYVAGDILLNMDRQQSTFPVTPGAFQTTPPTFAIQTAPEFAFLTKLNAAGSALVWSTFLYASDKTWSNDLTVDAAGSAVIVGTTYAFDFPATPGALRQCKPSGTWGATGYVLKLAPDGSRPLYSTYLGADELTAVAVDGSGEIYIAGGSADLLPIVPGFFGWNGSGAFAAALAPAALPAGSVSCVVSAASRGGAAIAPGEIVDILGNGIGPAQTVLASAVSGQIPTSLGGVQVLFNGVAAPLLSAGLNQIRAVVPFEIAPAVLDYGPSSADMQILNVSAVVQPAAAPVAVVAPAIFTVDGGSAGQALMINEDGTLNSPQNPARQGSIVSIYATGLNNTQPPLATGAIAPGADLLAFVAQLQIAFGQGESTYAGAAPGFAAGLTQINFRVPVSSFHGFAPLEITVADAFSSQVGVYFYRQ